jgi:hypothetical protein
MTAVISPPPRLQFFTNAGVPMASGLLYTYAAGTTTPLVTYTDSTGLVANTNPVILDSRGEASIWLGGVGYKFKLATPANVDIWTQDNISPGLASPTAIGNVTPNTGAFTALTCTAIAGFGTTALANSQVIIRGSGTGSATNTIRNQNSAFFQTFLVRDDGLINTGVDASLTFAPYNNTTASAANMTVDAGGNLQRSTSSRRYKNDIQDAIHGLADVLKLRPVTYRGNNDGITTFGGFVAEEVHEAGLSEFVFYDADGRPDALHYGNMVALMTKGIQELTARVVALETTLAALAP